MTSQSKPDRGTRERLWAHRADDEGRIWRIMGGSKLVDVTDDYSPRAERDRLRAENERLKEEGDAFTVTGDELDRALDRAEKAEAENKQLRKALTFAVRDVTELRGVPATVDGYLAAASRDVPS